MLSIAETHAQMGKIANNIENHGEEEVTAFDIPISGILLTVEQMNALLDEPYADRALFNKKRTGAIEPMFRQFRPLVYRDDFDKATVRMKVGDVRFTVKNCKVKSITIEPQTGGSTELSFKLRLRPENDKQILALLGHQHQSIKIEVSEAKVADKGDEDKQGELLDGADGKGGDKEGEEFEKSAKAQVEAFKNGKEDKKPPRNGREAH